MKQKFSKFIAILFLMSQLFLFESCKTLFVKDPQKAAVKKQKKEIKEEQKVYNATLKSHFRHQDKATRRRMKKKYRALHKKNKKEKKGWKCQ